MFHFSVGNVNLGEDRGLDTDVRRWIANNAVHIRRDYHQRVLRFHPLIISKIVDIQTLGQLVDLLEFFLCEANRLRRKVFENTTALAKGRYYVQRTCNSHDLSDIR